MKTNELEKTIERCMDFSDKLDRCFIIKESNAYCKYMSQKPIRKFIRDAKGMPYLIEYYLCEKK